MDKSSFHQNIEEQLKQIETERSFGGGNNGLQQQEGNVSREYLRGLDVMDKFKKKDVVKDEIEENEVPAGKSI